MLHNGYQIATVLLFGLALLIVLVIGASMAYERPRALVKFLLQVLAHVITFLMVIPGGTISNLDRSLMQYFRAKNKTDSIFAALGALIWLVVWMFVFFILRSVYVGIATGETAIFSELLRECSSFYGVLLCASLALQAGYMVYAKFWPTTYAFIWEESTYRLGWGGDWYDNTWKLREVGYKEYNGHH
jgi:hypothetical protein